MSREYLVYTALLVLSLVAAYLSSIADKTVGERAEITVFNVALADIKSGHYYTEKRDFNLTRAAHGEGLIVEQVQRPAAKDDSSAAETSVFLANEDFAAVFTGFAPLLARRMLGKADKVDLELFGLKEDKVRLVLQTKDAAQPTIEFAVGKKSYGTSEFYVQYAGTVYLVEGRSIDRIARARSLLFEKSFMAVTFSDGMTAVLEADGNSMTATLQGTLADIRHGRPRADENGKWLVDKVEHRQFGNWLRRLRGMEVGGYQRALPKDAAVVMTLTLKQDDAELERLRFWQWRVATDVVYAVQSKLSGDLYAQLPATRMQQLLADLRAGKIMQAAR